MFDFEKHKAIVEKKEYFKALSEHRKAELVKQKEYATEKRSIAKANEAMESLKTSKKLELKNSEMERFKTANPYATAEELRKAWDDVDSKADYEAEAHDYTGHEQISEAIKGVAAEVDAIYGERFSAEDERLKYAMEKLDSGVLVDEVEFKNYTPASE